MLIWMIESTLAAGILAGIAWLFSKRFRHMPALLHLAWFVVMIRLIMPPLPFPLPLSQTLHHLSEQTLDHFVPQAPIPAENSPSRSDTSQNLSLAQDQVTPGQLLVLVNPKTQPVLAQPDRQSAPSHTPLESAKVVSTPVSIHPHRPEPSVSSEAIFSMEPAPVSPSEALINPHQPLNIAAWRTWPWKSLLLLIWFAGTGLIILLNGFRMWAMRRTLAKAPFGEITLLNQVTTQAVKMGIKPPAVVMQDAITTPFVWCLGKPVLVWPSQLTPWQGRHGQAEMLTHELAHLKRRDHWFVWAELTIGACLWWHPLFWLARAQMRFYAELACDATVINQKPQQRESYARALVDAMAQLQLSKPKVGALALGPSKKKAFEKRLAAIMNKKTTQKTPLWALFFLVTAGFLVLPALKPNPAPAPPLSAAQNLANDLDFLDPQPREKVQARATYEMAKRYVRAEQWGRAETALKKSIQLNPSDAHVWSKYGEILLESGKYQEAIAAFEKHNSLGGHSRGDLLIAQAYAKGGQLGEAMELLESLGRRGELHPESLGDIEFTALADEPNFAQLTLRSVQYHKQSHHAREAMEDKEYRKAATLFQNLTKIAPESSWVWDRLCFVLAPLKEFDQAEQALQKAMALTPDVPHLYYNQGCLFVLQGNNADAMPLLRKALDMGFHNYDLMRKDPDLDPIRNKSAFKKLLAEMENERIVGKQIEELHENGSPRELLEFLESAASLKNLDDKDHAYLQRMRGLANLELDRFEEAADAFREEIRLAKPNKMKNPLYNLACAFAGQGRTQEALASLGASMAVGYKNHHHMEKDKDLMSLRDEPAFREMVQQAGRERLLRRYKQVDWASFETWVDQQLADNAFTRKELAKLSKHLYNGKAWFQAGKAYGHLSELDSDEDIPYNAACSYALAGETDLAFQWLEKAIAAGFHNRNHMRRDSDLTSLKSDSRWQQIQDSL